MTERQGMERAFLYHKARRAVRETNEEVHNARKEEFKRRLAAEAAALEDEIGDTPKA